MFNKESCRKCGWILVPTMNCNICLETLHWTCNNCTNTEDHVRIHNLEKTNRNKSKRKVNLDIL